MGGAVQPASLTDVFRSTRDSVDYDWSSKGAPPSFHEQRSLAERLFREQGIDTQILSGQRRKIMAVQDNDTCGKEWKNWPFDDQFCRGFAEKLKNDNPQRT